MIGPCSSWATEDELCVPCLDQIAYIDFDTYLQQASELLYQLSGQQFSGICTETIEPCSQRFSGHPTQFEPFMTAPIRHLHPQSPFPWTGCGHDNPCGCPGFPAIQIPRIDVIDVISVTLTNSSGDVITYTAYDGVFELEGDFLLRVDGDRWPTCDPDFTVTYEFGTAPPTSGVQAAAVLACELLLACNPEALPDAKCRLPRNISSISRQGVSVIFERLTRNRGPFRFGIWEIDVFLEAYNPHGVSAPSVVMSPDTMNIARRIP